MKVDWIILADYTEVVNAKLYLTGGGWETLTVNSGFPVPYQCGVAVAFSVPWTETNQAHDMAVQISDDDEAHKLAEINGQFEVGRPPGIRLGQSQRVQFAVNLPLVFPKPGGYIVKARVEDQVLGSTTFAVVAGPSLALTPPRDQEEK